MVGKRRVLRELTPAQEFSRLVASVSYSERLLTVRAYYDGFSPKDGFDRHKITKLSPAQKSAITRHYKAIRPYLSTPTVRTKKLSKANAQAAWRSLHGVAPPKKTRRVPIHESPQNKPVLKFKSVGGERRATVRMPGVQVENYFFGDYDITPADIATDPEAALAAMLDEIDAPRYAIVCGANLFSNFASSKRGSRSELRDNTVYIGTKSEVIVQVRKLQKMYSDPTKNNYWGNWFNGFKGYFFAQGKRAEFEKYRKEVGTAKVERVERWRDLKNLNRVIDNAAKTIAKSERSLKHYKRHGAVWEYGVAERNNAIKILNSRIANADKNMADATRDRVLLIAELTKGIVK